MQFLRTKLEKIKTVTKSIFPSNNKIVNSPKELLQHLITSPDDTPDIEVHKQLADISRKSQRNAQIADFVIIKMENFKYQIDVMRKTQKILSVTIYLLKNGGYTFALDLKNNLNTLRQLQAIDSKYFEGKFKKKAKELDYRLEVIKHRAKYIEKLVTDEEMLTEERKKAEWKRKNQIVTSNEEDIGATSTGLKMGGQNQLTKFDLQDKSEKEEEPTCQELKLVPLHYPTNAIEA